MNTWYGPNWAPRIRPPTISHVVHSNLIVSLHHKLEGFIIFGYDRSSTGRAFRSYCSSSAVRRNFSSPKFLPSGCAGIEPTRGHAARHGARPPAHSATGPAMMVTGNTPYMLLHGRFRQFLDQRMVCMEVITMDSQFLRNSNELVSTGFSGELQWIQALAG